MTEKEIVSALRVTESRSKRELLDAAADLIEKLTDRCARYAEEIAVAQERTRWIPVTERLPEDPVQKVLIFVPHPALQTYKHLYGLHFHSYQSPQKRRVSSLV